MNKIKKILIIGFVWPEPNSSAAGSRMMQLISFFKKNNYEITFASAAQDSNFMVDLANFDVQKVSIELNNSSFDNFIVGLNPDVVLFDRFMVEEQFGWRVADNCPNALRLLDTEDLHCLRLARQKAFKENKIFKISDLLFEEVAKREIASILRCDMSFMISEFEIELLQKVFKISSEILIYLPFLYDEISEEFFLKYPSFDERSDFIFIGNFLHEPNWNTVQYLKETIWPLIRKELPKVSLKIYGGYPSQKVLQLHSPKDGFLIMGRATDANTVVQEARVVLAPIRFGAGLKGKLAEAMINGTPSVTTSIGAEAMNDDLDWNGFITDDSFEISKRAIELYSDKEAWLMAQKKGVQIINKRFNKTAFEEKLKISIENLITNKEKHRENNFLGSLLQYHTLRSTKYMAKWIEEKNK